jgi:hypothetical protein
MSKTEPKRTPPPLGTPNGGGKRAPLFFFQDPQRPYPDHRTQTRIRGTGPILSLHSHGKTRGARNTEEEKKTHTHRNLERTSRGRALGRAENMNVNQEGMPVADKSVEAGWGSSIQCKWRFNEAKADASGRTRHGAMPA